MRYIAMLAAVCFISTIGFCQTSPTTSDPNAAAKAKQSKQATKVQQHSMDDAEQEHLLKKLWEDAYRFYHEKKYKEACEKCSQIIALESDSYDAYFFRCTNLAEWAVEQKDANLFAKARNDYEELKALALEHNDDLEISQWQTMAGYHLALAYINAQKLDCARDIYVNLTKLANNHKTKPVLKDQQVRAGVELARAYGTARDWKNARNMLDEIEPFANALPEGKTRQELLGWITGLRQMPWMQKEN
ncbi:MAG: hypothetical protein PHF37_02910 [Phycisphaerae bacterium]|nr:hypothetical protein [Phycisphaerae bacterium]